MNKQLTSIISYFSILCWFIAYMVGDREGAKFYLNQSLLIAILGTVLGVLMQFFHGTVISVILSIVNVGVAVLCVIGIYHAFKQDDKPIPIIGGITILK